MIIPYLRIDPFVFETIVFSILTIFGRKGKKPEKEEEKTDKTPVIQEPVKEVLGQNGTSASAPQTDNPSTNSEAQPSTDETSLNKLLQSLLQEMPFNPPPEADTTETPTSSPADWVPPRATPLSRPMVVVPGEKGERVLAAVQPEEHAFSKRNAQPAEPEPRPPIQPSKQLGPGIRKLEQPDQEAKKPAKPEKPEKAEGKQQSPGPATKGTQNFEHIFDLTQNALNQPGLVLVNGQLGSGKTSLSSSLAGTYLRRDMSCLIVEYDQSAPSLRDSIKKTGWDAAQFESQFKLLIVDGFATQSDSISLEPYYVEKPFDLDNLAEALVRNTQIFMGSRVQIILDSLTEIAMRAPQNEFLNKFRDLLKKTRESGGTFVATLDESKLSKDLTDPLEDMAACVVDLQKDGENSGRLKVRKLNGTISKSQPEVFQIEPGKGLLFA